jgi:hypothetical protein
VVDAPVVELLPEDSMLPLDPVVVFVSVAISSGPALSELQANTSAPVKCRSAKTDDSGGFAMAQPPCSPRSALPTAAFGEGEV